MGLFRLEGIERKLYKSNYCLELEMGDEMLLQVVKSMITGPTHEVNLWLFGEREQHVVPFPVLETSLSLDRLVETDEDGEEHVKTGLEDYFRLRVKNIDVMDELLPEEVMSRFYSAIDRAAMDDNSIICEYYDKTFPEVKKYDFKGLPSRTALKDLAPDFYNLFRIRHRRGGIVGQFIYGLTGYTFMKMADIAGEKHVAWGATALLAHHCASSLASDAEFFREKDDHLAGKALRVAEFYERLSAQAMYSSQRMLKLFNDIKSMCDYTNVLLQVTDVGTIRDKIYGFAKNWNAIYT